MISINISPTMHHHDGKAGCRWFNNGNGNNGGTNSTNSTNGNE